MSCILLALVLGVTGSEQERDREPESNRITWEKPAQTNYQQDEHPAQHVCFGDDSWGAPTGYNDPNDDHGQHVYLGGD